MSDLTFVLLSDGSSDRTLIPILKWVLREHFGAKHAFTGDWADLRQLRRPPSTLADKIERCLDIYKCDLLFIHRDAERQLPEMRVAEIEDALAELQERKVKLPRYVPVIPVRMREAWLLFDERAIRWAAENPNGTEQLTLPSLGNAEDVPDPKSMLYKALEQASELTGRRLKKFRTSVSASRVSDFIDDFKPLRGLKAFQQLESDVQTLQFPE